MIGCVNGILSGRSLLTLTPLISYNNYPDKGNRHRTLFDHMLQLFLLGPLRIRFEPDGPLHLLTGNSATLLGYLGLQAHTHFQVTRSRLAGTLWPDVDEERARHILSNTLYRLHKQQPELTLYLHSTTETISLNNPTVDVVTFRQLTSSDNPADWRIALGLYQGDLLEEIEASWAVGERALLHEQHLATLTRTCHHLEQTDATNLHEALLFARRWAQADPLNEQPYINLIRLYTRLGRPAAARHQYKTLQTLLADELGLEPSPETTALYETLQPAAVIDSSPPPFVGRQSERSQLLAQVAQLIRGQGGVALIEGEPGIGKTTLLQEVARTAAWQTVTAVWGNSPENSPLPYAPLTDVLHTLIQKPLFQATLNHLPPLLHQLLAPLLHSTLSAPLVHTAAHKSQFTADMPLTAALRHLLQSWLTHGPILLLLDDVHWASPQFWSLLPTLAELTRQRPLLIFLAYRRWELEQETVAWQAVQTLERTTRPCRLTLDGLTATDVAELTATHTSTKRVNPAELYQLSGGNPLLLQELLHQPEAQSATLAPLLAERLAQLSLADQEALAAGAILGRDISFPYWGALLQRPLDGSTIQRLISSRFIRETAEGYTFQHDLVRLHLYQQIEPLQKEHWHRQTAVLLRQAGEPPEAIAWHYAQAHAPHEAVYYYQRAAEQALALRATASIQRFATIARQLAADAHLPARETLSLRWLQLQIAHQERPSSDRLPEIEALTAEAEALRDEEILLRLTLIKFDLLSGQGAQKEVAAVQQTILDLVEGVGNRPLEMDALQQLAIKTAFTEGDSDRALIYARWSETLAATLPTRPELLAEAKLVMVACLLRGRQPAEALNQLHAVKLILDQHPELHHVESDWRYLWAVAAQFTGDWDTSHRLHEESLQLHRETGNFYALTTALYNTANSAMHQGTHEQAILYATEMVALAEQQLAADDLQKKLEYCTLLAQCYLQAEMYTLAQESLAPLREWLERQTGGATAVRAWSTVGEICVGLGRLEEGYAAQKRAVAFGKGIQGVTARPFLALADVCWQTDRRAEGEEALAEAKNRINFDAPSMSTHIYFYYLSYRYRDDVVALERAYECLIEQSQRFSDPQTQQGYLARFLLHRQVITLREARKPLSQEVQLVRSDVPLGRPLTERDFVIVRWTPDDGVGDAAVLETEGKKAVRRRRLTRLMYEAKAQGATPSFADLATALAVSVRTIERDVKWLISQEIEPHTRRYAQAS